MSTETAATLALTVNGEPRRAAPGSIADLVRSLELDPAKVAVERNGEIVPRSTLAAVATAEGEAPELGHFVGCGHDADSLPGRVRTFGSAPTLRTCQSTDLSPYGSAGVPSR